MVGVAFSPGGLLFPYHVGVGYALQRAGVITDETPLAGGRILRVDSDVWPAMKRCDRPA